MSLHLCMSDVCVDITQVKRIQKRRFTIVRYERERSERGCFFFQRGNAEGILSLDYNQDNPREGGEDYG